RGLVAGRRRALPGELGAPSAHQLGVPPGRWKCSEAIVEDRRGRGRLHQRQDRDNEGLDVPHLVAIVVVIVVPGRQTEDRGRRRRRRMDRTVQVEERGVNQALPFLVSPDDPYAALPELLPRVAVLGADRLEPIE